MLGGMSDTLYPEDGPVSAETYSYIGYLEDVAIALRAHPEWRVGQGYFNVLTYCRPDISEKVRATSVDPFYSDNRLPAFHGFVHEAWPCR